MNAIPTKYAGVQFRSRLEARWAAFFELADWRWEYEPIDLAGWIPDFYVWPQYASTKSGWLIEIKPAFALSGFRLDRYQGHIDSGNIPENCEGIGLLGATIQRYCLGRKRDAPEESLDGCQLGWFLNAVPDGRVGGNYWMSKPVEYRYQCGEANPLFLYFVAEYWEGEEMWREAGNLVQWKAPH